ncbi:MAG TPA: class I SAM-dependent methyltransferase [Xanthobacteraceae bacterium]|jgi:methylation protein EvaC|nr:class I SAM-dependent methyltransferase [Xanthobacteraceae bacterium]
MTQMIGARTSRCRVCAAAMSPFMSFGRMPIANGFLRPNKTENEYFFELSPAFCEACGMFQLMEQPLLEKMFHEQYAFYSSTSRYMQVHFEAFAHAIINTVLAGRDHPFVVELGSNDGIMLRHFKAHGVRHLGIEPSANVAEVARSQGISTISAFFDPKLADEIAAAQGGADAILATNVICHIPDLPGVAAGVQRLLKQDGVFIFEDPYLGDMIAKTSYDQIYDEHVFIFSATSVQCAFARFGFELVDVAPQITHGGSMRYTLAPKGSRQVSKKVNEQLAKEAALGLDRAETYLQFKANCENSRAALMQTLERLRSEHKRVVGYGATSKSTTVVNYCGITPAHVEFISDTTPIKQGKLSPGAHIPVKAHGEFVKRYPDYALLFAWNHAAEIREKETGFLAAGGRWIVYVPHVAIVS